jgi:hypothetical protein
VDGADFVVGRATGRCGVSRIRLRIKALRDPTIAIPFADNGTNLPAKPTVS